MRIERGANASAASRVLIPRKRSSFTRRFCNVRLARSTWPLAWLVLAHMMSMFSSKRTRPNCVVPRPKSGRIAHRAEDAGLVAVELHRLAMLLEVGPRGFGSAVHLAAAAPNALAGL
jgi:hypothetical protein